MPSVGPASYEVLKAVICRNPVSGYRIELSFFIQMRRWPCPLISTASLRMCMS